MKFYIDAFDEKGNRLTGSAEGQGPVTPVGDDPLKSVQWRKLPMSGTVARTWKLMDARGVMIAQKRLTTQDVLTKPGMSAEKLERIQSLLRQSMTWTVVAHWRCRWRQSGQFSFVAMTLHSHRWGRDFRSPEKSSVSLIENWMASSCSSGAKWMGVMLRTLDAEKIPVRRIDPSVEYRHHEFWRARQIEKRDRQRERLKDPKFIRSKMAELEAQGVNMEGSDEETMIAILSNMIEEIRGGHSLADKRRVIELPPLHGVIRVGDLQIRPHYHRSKHVHHRVEQRVGRSLEILEEGLSVDQVVSILKSNVRL